MPPTFSDGFGRKWHPRITCGVAREFEDATGECLFSQKTLDAMAHLESIGLLLRLAHLACKWERNTKIEDFCEAFVDDIQLKAALSATCQALIKFFPEPQFKNTTTKREPWSWDAVAEIAALANVAEPWPYSLRELVLRHKALNMAAWDRVAWLCKWTAQPHSKSELSAEFFHPFRSKSGSDDQATTVAELRKLKDRLPVKRTEAEKKAAWAEYKRKIEEREAR